MASFLLMLLLVGIIPAFRGLPLWETLNTAVSSYVGSTHCNFTCKSYS
jgi:hypothetical protein